MRAHQYSVGDQKKPEEDAALGASKGGMSTQIHATCSALDNSTGFYLTIREAHDLEGADVLWNDIQADALLCR